MCFYSCSNYANFPLRKISTAELLMPTGTHNNEKKCIN